MNSSLAPPLTSLLADAPLKSSCSPLSPCYISLKGQGEGRFMRERRPLSDLTAGARERSGGRSERFGCKGGGLLAVAARVGWFRRWVTSAGTSLDIRKFSLLEALSFRHVDSRSSNLLNA